MSFFRRRPNPLDPSCYRDIEEYAYALMRLAVPTDVARELLRVAVRRDAAQRQADSEAWRREQAEDLADRRQMAAEISAARLLREAGWLDEWAGWP